jgi:hypothetical protein
MITDIQSATAPGHSDVLAALRAASSKTGLDFDYLLHTAMRESSLNTDAKSKTSSASGLFQFIDQTWLGLIKRYGERYGLSSYANSIQQSADGHYAVESAGTKSAILALRQDPELSAVMAGEAAKQTKQTLECALGREVCGGELYAAHVFGASGARHLIELKERNPDGRADMAFPQAAKANRSVFYNADGTAKSVSELYDWAVGGAPAQSPMQSAVSSVAPAPRPAPAAIASADARDLLSAFEPSRPESAASTLNGGNILTPSHRNVGATAWLGNAILSPPAPQTLPKSPVLLSPGIVEILATLSPATIRRAA